MKAFKIFIIKGGLGNQLYIANAIHGYIHKYRIYVIYSSQLLHSLDPANNLDFSLISPDIIVLGWVPFRHTSRNNFYATLINRFLTRILNVFSSFSFLQNCLYHGYAHDCNIETSSLRNLQSVILKQACMMPNITRFSGEVLIHIRGGDYLSKEAKSIYSQISSEWYAEQVRRVIAMYNVHKFAIATNDITHAKSIIDFMLCSLKEHQPTFRYLPNTSSAIKDIHCMSYYPIIICANSTYSLWACFFSKIIHGNTHSECILPRNYYVNSNLQYPSTPHSFDFVCK